MDSKERREKISEFIEKGEFDKAGVVLCNSSDILSDKEYEKFMREIKMGERIKSQKKKQKSASCRIRIGGGPMLGNGHR